MAQESRRDRSVPDFILFHSETLSAPSEDIGKSYIWPLLRSEVRAFSEIFEALDQQVLKAAWTVIEPQPRHAHHYTIVLLHERTDFPQRLAKRLFKPEDKRQLHRRFPHVRWVFPKAPPSLMRFGRPPMWFGNDENPSHDTERKDNIGYLNHIIEQEAKLLGGNSNKIYLAGLEQGAAMGLLTLLSRSHPLTGFIGVGGWLHVKVGLNDSDELPRRVKEGQLNTPVFLVHDERDKIVNLNEAKEMHAMLQELGMGVTYAMKPSDDRNRSNQTLSWHDPTVVTEQRLRTDILIALAELYQDKLEPRDRERQPSPSVNNESFQGDYRIIQGETSTLTFCT